MCMQTHTYIHTYIPRYVYMCIGHPGVHADRDPREVLRECLQPSSALESEQ